MNWLVKEEPENYSYATFLKDKTTAEWLAILEPADIWCADILNWQQLMDHEGFKVLDMIQQVEMSDGFTYRTTRCPIRIDGELFTSDKASPKLGEDNRQIIKEFGLSERISEPLAPSSTIKSTNLL